MRKAVVDITTGFVDSVIECEDDHELEGFDLIAVPEGQPVASGWHYEDGGYAPPEPAAAPVPDSVSETQFMRAATRMGWVSGDDAEAYLARGVIPAFVEAALSMLPASERTDARLKVIGANTFERADPVFATLIEGGVATAEQVDGLFQLADTLI